VSATVSTVIVVAWLVSEKRRTISTVETRAKNHRPDGRELESDTKPLGVVAEAPTSTPFEVQAETVGRESSPQLRCWMPAGCEQMFVSIGRKQKFGQLG
jgi:hypothetical protein